MSDIRQLAQNLLVALKALQMYTANHPRSQESLASALTALDRELAGRQDLQFVVTGGKAFVDGQVQDARNAHVAALVRLISERAASGFVFEPGVTAEELQAFLGGLATKPARLEEEGGFETLLTKAGVRHIRVSQTRYQEIREGSEVPSEGGAPTFNPAPPPASDSPEGLVSFLREALLSNLGTPEQAQGTAPESDGDGLGFLRNLKAADLSGLGALGYNLGLREEVPTPIQMGTLRQVLLGVEPVEQLRLLVGLASLPDQPPGLGLGVKAMAGEIFAAAIQAFLQKGHSWSQIKGPLLDLLRPHPQRKELLNALGAHLRNVGQDDQPAEAMLRELEWEELSLEARLLKILEEGYLFLLSLEQRLAFLRELLELRRHDEFLRILDLLIEALQSERPDLRLKGAQTLSGVARWIQIPGLPLGGEGTLAEALRAHFAWEPDPPIHKWTVEAIDAFITALIQRGDLTRAITELQDLEGLCTFLDEQQPWRSAALDQLRDVMFRVPLLDAALERAFLLPREAVTAEVYPYFEFLGDPMARHLVLRLADEEDRTRRGRLVDSLRALGPLAIPPLMEALRSPTWYLVRNALTLLSDLGDAGSIPELLPLLHHPEPRVCRTAVRALWKLGGPVAEPHLLPLMKDTDGGTLQEILFVLGQLKSESSLPAVMEMAQDKRVVEALRIQALDTLGHIASPKAMGVLQECLRRRGFFGGGEVPEVRMAAAKALMTLGTEEAKDTLRKVVEADPRGDERESLRRILAVGRPS